MIAALFLFNVLFAVENGLDLAFLWSGAPLPAGVTLADYAHRGAYLLVLTALLAGGFSLLLLREGSPTASRPLIRWLVGAWVAQNVLLSASSLLRTVDYVEAYSLTQLRLAALDPEAECEDAEGVVGAVGMEAHRGHPPRRTRRRPGWARA